ncbi:MAG: DUF6682 family protein [Armatimonadia bacterium]
MTPADIIAECRRLLNDTVEPYRYSTTMLLGYVNQALKRTAVLRPDLFGKVVDIATTPNSSIQDLPADAHRLLDIFQIKDGTTVTETDRETLSRYSPSWMTETGTPVNFMRHPRNPTKFFLYPRPGNGVVLVGEYASAPADVAVDAAILQPAASFFGALVDCVMFLASSVDDEHVNSGRSKIFLDSFTQQLGVSLENRPLTDTKQAGLRPGAGLTPLGEVY